MRNTRKFLMHSIVTVSLTLILPYFSGERVFGQEESTPQTDERSNERVPDRADGDLIGRLNLTPDQIRQIREIRHQSADEMRVSRQRLGRAQVQLDEAIYADSVDEAAIEMHARDLAAAQAAVARIRAMTELRIRRILSSEQLSLLRTFRREARERGRNGTRELRRNPSAFQERRRQRAFEPDRNNASPGTTNTPQRNSAPLVRTP